MFLRNLNVRFSVALVVLQQVFLAISTYFIASAGAALGDGSEIRAANFVALFFIFALLAYLTSSLSTISSVKGYNQIWYKYATRILNDSTDDIRYCSSNNKLKISNWINNEAASTIPEATLYYIGFTSILLNVIFTLLVFFMTIGAVFTLSVSVALGMSAAIVAILRKKIGRMGSIIQNDRLNLTTSTENTWGRSAFGTKNIKADGFENFKTRSIKYFTSVEKYTLLEQMLACTPIVIAVAALVGMIKLNDQLTLAMIGTLVAVLPRSLQLFGNIHSLSIYMSQFYLIKEKINNLESFVERLDVHSIEYLNNKLCIFNQHNGSAVSPVEFKKKLKANDTLSGRYCIKGPNGSGKSTLLKNIKSEQGDSLLLVPEVFFLDPKENLSTGQKALLQLKSILEAPPSLLMLDEWDANLDSNNTHIIDELIDQISQKSLVIEVRHKTVVDHEASG